VVVTWGLDGTQVSMLPMPLDALLCYCGDGGGDGDGGGCLRHVSVDGTATVNIMIDMTWLAFPY
jgi:hypothetical protein